LERQFVNDLKLKYNLPDTAAYDFMTQKIVNFSQINSKFYEAQAFNESNWKMLILKIDTCLLDMLVMAFTTKCANEKCIIQEAAKNCKCNFCNDIRLLKSIYVRSK
jgi:hypothetical protein